MMIVCSFCSSRHKRLQLPTRMKGLQKTRSVNKRRINHTPNVNNVNVRYAPPRLDAERNTERLVRRHQQRTSNTPHTNHVLFWRKDPLNPLKHSTMKILYSFEYSTSAEQQLKRKPVVFLFFFELEFVYAYPF